MSEWYGNFFCCHWNMVSWQPVIKSYDIPFRQLNLSPVFMYLVFHCLKLLPTKRYSSFRKSLTDSLISYMILNCNHYMTKFHRSFLKPWVAFPITNATNILHRISISNIRELLKSLLNSSNNGLATCIHLVSKVHFFL